MSTNSTSFYINLAGNIGQQSQRFGRDITQFSNKSTGALSKLSARLRATTSELRGIGGAISSMSNKINGIGNIALPVIGVGVGAGLATVGKSMVRTAADFEMADIRMNQIFGKRGKEASAWLKKFAVDTPMAFMDVQDAMMRLETAGIDPMNGSLQALVDYNAKIGGGKDNLNGYIAAISKGFIKGKLSMEEINPLLERNVKVFEILARETGGKYTADQMQKMLQEGKLGRKAIQALLRGMGKDAAGAAKGQMKTWDGLVSNLGDTWTAMQARFMEHGAFDALKKELGGLLEWLNAKMEDGTLDEFAKIVSDTLITALRDLKGTAENIKPALEGIGSVMSWVAENAGGYGNIAKFVAAFYAANKVARIAGAIGQSTVNFGKGAYGLGRNVYGVGATLFGRRKAGGKGSAVADVVGGLAGTAGVQPVFVTNMPALGSMGLTGGRRQITASKRALKAPSKPVTAAKALPAKTAATTVTAVKTPLNPTALAAVQASKPVTPAKALPASNAVRQSVAPLKSATGGIKNLTATAARNTAVVATKATAAINSTVSRAMPMIGTGLMLAQGAMVMMDEETSVADKSEAIGSLAGATAGAILGQAVLPIPVVGAMIGSYLGDKIGSWVGREAGEAIGAKTSQPKIDPQQAAQQVGSAMGNFIGSEVGAKLSGINPVETKLDGAVKVAVTLSDDLRARVTQSDVKTNQKGRLQMQVETGYTGVGLYGGA